MQKRTYNKYERRAQSYMLVLKQHEVEKLSKKFV